MIVPELIAEVETRGGRLLLDDGRVKYRGPEALLTPALRDALSRHRDRIATTLAASAPTGSTSLGGLRLSEFATSARVIRIRSAVIGADVYFAADNADISAVPPEAVIFWPDELADITADGPDYLLLLWEVKQSFSPHGRTEKDSE